MNVPTCCRKIPIPYALLSGLTTAGLLLMAIQARPLPGLTLPPVPVIQTREIPEPEPEPIPARPKRDPFRPLNHPVTSSREVPVKKGGPAVPAIPAMPAAKLSSGQLQDLFWQVPARTSPDWAPLKRSTAKD